MHADTNSELLARVQVVDGASLHFRDYGTARHDNWDIEWEATPPPASRTEVRPTRTPPARTEHVPAPDATPGGAPRSEPEPEADRDDADTFPPLADTPPAVHELHPPPVVGGGDDASTWDPAEGRTVSPEVEPGAFLPPPQLAGQQAVDALPVVFDGLSPRVVEAAVDHFDVFEVQPGTQLIQAGERHPALVMVLSGEVVADRDGILRRAEAGECLGFTTLFGDGIWPSTLSARVATRLLVLGLEGFRALRDQGSVVSVAIEEYALELLMDGLQNTRLKVGQMSSGKPIADFVPKPRFFDVLADAFGMGGIMAARCNKPKALEASPLFRNAQPRHLEALAERMGALKAQAGTFFLRQGEANTSMYLVVSGQVDVLTSGASDRAVRHETLGPGQAFGLWAMLTDYPSRTSVLARSKCVVLELEKLDWAELAPAHTGTGSVLRLAVLRALTERLVREAARMASLEAGHAPDVVDPTISGSFMTINPIDRR